MLAEVHNHAQPHEEPALRYPSRISISTQIFLPTQLNYTLLLFRLRHDADRSEQLVAAHQPEPVLQPPQGRPARRPRQPRAPHRASPGPQRTVWYASQHAKAAVIYCYQYLCSLFYFPIGYIPDSMGLMIGLTELTMTQNQLMGDIPESLGNLTALSTLVLSHNQLSGAYPLSRSRTCAYVCLIYGVCSGRPVIHFCVENWRASVELTVFCLRSAGSIPETVGGMTSMETLNLSHNQLTGTQILGLFLRLYGRVTHYCCSYCYVRPDPRRHCEPDQDEEFGPLLQPALRFVSVCKMQFFVLVCWRSFQFTSFECSSCAVSVQ